MYDCEENPVKHNAGREDRRMFVYLDNSATTRQSDEVTDAMLQMMREDFGNPSSLHRMGVTAENSLKHARKQTARSLGVREDEIYFTSGGTESNNTAIFGAFEARKRTGNKIITSKIEHPAVLEACRKLERLGVQVSYLDVGKDGLVDLSQMKRELDGNTVLITVMHVNNELGTVEPLAEIGRLKQEAEKEWGREILFHTDAVQSYGKVAMDISGCGVDMLSVSGHKIHGPKGIGAVYIKSGIHIPSFIYGGGQERGFRSGTENLPAIVGMGYAAQLAAASRTKKMEELGRLKERLKNGIQDSIGDIRINSPRDGLCSSAILNISFMGCRGEVLLHMLEQKDIYVSTGSACSAHKRGSHVLEAIHLTPDEVEGAVRFSLSDDNTEEQIDYTIKELTAAVESQRRLRGAFGRTKD